MLWGARFRRAPDASLMRLSRADPSHLRLIPYDLIASQAHARELQRAEILTPQETETICDMLSKLIEEYVVGAPWCRSGDEDVHTLLERVLKERLGALGGKLRAGRSRNDQAANDLKLYLRHEMRRLAGSVCGVIDVLCQLAEGHLLTVMPGMTHLQAAQPVTLAHHLLAHGQSLYRDVGRIIDWDDRHARSPLGAAALAGSAIALRPDLSASEMGYLGAAENSIDAVGSRDHVAECLFAAAMLGVNLSRLAEEVVLWSSQPFAWVELDDAFSTGSSIMPQKKNPDIAELTRGRSGRFIGHVAAMLATLKGLPFAYNRDLSEDKHLVFDALDTLRDILPAIEGMLRTLRFDENRLAAHATNGFSLATEVADWLAKQGIAFAQAHEITGALVRYCESNGKTLNALDEGELLAVSPHLRAEVLQHLSALTAVKARCGYCGTAPESVERQLLRLRQHVRRQREWVDCFSGPNFSNPEINTTVA
jgi:argininosuccinate lyase